IFIQLTDGTTVRTLNVISINFKLRFSVNRSFVGKQYVVILLKSIGFLGMWMHHHLSVKYARSIVVINAFVQFVAFTVLLLMVGQCVMIYKLLFANYGDTVHVAFGMLAFQKEIEIVANKFISKRKSTHAHIAALGLFYGSAVNKRSLQVVVLYFVIKQ